MEEVTSKKFISHKDFQLVLKKKQANNKQIDKV